MLIVGPRAAALIGRPLGGAAPAPQEDSFVSTAILTGTEDVGSGWYSANSLFSAFAVGDGPFLLGFNGEMVAGTTIQDVGIPQGSTINSAILSLNVTSTTPGINVTVSADDADNPANVGDGNRPSTWTPTSATVSYTDQATGIRNIDVTAIVQELVDRPGFAGNNMNFRLREVDPTGGKGLVGATNPQAPTLTVNWTPPV